MTEVNKSIGCNVSECKFHSDSDQYCSLNHIMVTHHSDRARTVEGTDCGSFRPKA